MKKTLFLFVPAVRLDRVAKAFDSGADEVIIDLEDTVAQHLKDDARQNLLAFDAGFNKPYWIRMNTGQDWQADVVILQKLRCLKGVFLPKCQSCDDVEHLHQQLGLPIIAMIETALGLVNIASIAKAKGLDGLSFGRLDMMQHLGLQPGSQASERVFDYVRTQLLVHCLANGLKPPIETIFADFMDDKGLMDCVCHWADFGFGGQLLIHPRQVTPVRQALSVDTGQFRLAQKIWSTYQATAQTVFSVDGQMVDLPLIAWAAQLLGEDLNLGAD